MTISSCAALALSIPTIALIGVITYNIKSIVGFILQPFKELKQSIDNSNIRFAPIFKATWRTAAYGAISFGLFVLITNTKIIPCGKKQVTEVRKNVEILADCGCD